MAARTYSSRPATAGLSPLSTMPTSSSISSSVSSAPVYVTDMQSGQRYLKGRFLGKGGFAKVYEFRDVNTNELYAGKVVEKKSLKKSRAQQKLLSEIKIHRSLDHPYIVKFERFFEDKENVYIVLEICENQSFMELMKKRRRLTEIETVYFMRQLLEATQFMHSRNVIHRDLKLGNLFLNSALDLKVGDFGLATTVEREGERKKTICGTPNYIAPEVLDSRHGHSYEVDIWSIGVILYTLLIGKPPFETADVKTTYERIRSNTYSFPDKVPISEAARSLIRDLLHSNPESRPAITDILNHRFFTNHRIPTSLPQSILHSAPLSHELEYEASSSSASLSAALSSLSNNNNNNTNNNNNGVTAYGVTKGSLAATVALSKENESPNAFAAAISSSSTNPSANSARRLAAGGSSAASLLPSSSAGAGVAVGGVVASSSSSSASSSAAAVSSAASVAGLTAGLANLRIASDDDNLANMHAQLTRSFAIMNAAPASASKTSGGQTPSSVVPLEPTTWVVKWVDYSNKYGLGYQLSDGTIGVYFNDNSKIALSPNAINVEYHERHRSASGGPSRDERQSHTMETYPDTLQKKMTLLKYFKNYLQEHLDRREDSESTASSSGSSAAGPACDLVYVKKWIRTKHAIILRLSNRTVQVNFFDHTKIILSSEAQLVTYVDKQRKICTHTLTAIMECPTPELVNRLKYAKDILFHLISSKTGKAEVPDTEGLDAEAATA